MPRLAAGRKVDFEPLLMGRTMSPSLFRCQGTNSGQLRYMRVIYLSVNFPRMKVFYQIEFLKVTGRSRGIKYTSLGHDGHDILKLLVYV